MEKQGKLETPVGTIEYDLLKGDYFWEGVQYYKNYRYCDKVFETNPERLSWYMSRDNEGFYFSRPSTKGLGQSDRYKMEIPGLVGYRLSIQILGPKVAQFPTFSIGMARDRDKETRRERVAYLLETNPDIKNWFVYLTTQQRWHLLVKELGFKHTQSFYNPNSENLIKEYYLAKP